MAGNLQRMVPPRSDIADSHLGNNFLATPELADKIGERPVSRWALPFQQTLTIKQAFLECATTVLAQQSLPNLYEIRHSRSNSELGSNDTDPFHGGGRLNDESPHTPVYTEELANQHFPTDTTSIDEMICEDEGNECPPGDLPPHLVSEGGELLPQLVSSSE